MSPIFLQTEFAWPQLIQYGPTVVILAMILVFLIRILPSWKEVRLRELDLRGEENVVKREQAGALSQLAGALTHIAVEQRRATEEVGILQRYHSDSNDRLANNVHGLTERLDKLEELHADGLRRELIGLTSRVESVEKNVGSQSTTA
jgi:hypothetical protein